MDTDDLYRLLRNAHLQEQGVMDTLRVPLLVLDPGLCVMNGSQAFFETFRVSRFETIGQPLYELGNGQWDIPELRVLLEQVVPRSTSVVDYEVRADFPDLGERTMLVSAWRLIHPDSNSRVLLLSMVDATERRRWEEEQQVLISELRHRMRNLLTVIEALARQTETEGRTGEEYRTAFLGRLQALARAQELVSDTESAVRLEALVRKILEPYSAEGAIKLEPGADVLLAQDQLLSVSLIVHELATNALKHGALSMPNGRVSIRWASTGTDGAGRRLPLQWKEMGGPPASPPTKPGFGSRLMEFAARRDLGGRWEQSFTSDGLLVEVEFPL